MQPHKLMRIAQWHRLYAIKLAAKAENEKASDSAKELIIRHGFAHIDMAEFCEQLHAELMAAYRKAMVRELDHGR